MLERHKKLLRPLVAELRKVLAGSNDEQGNWQRGDLDRELERLGFGPDGTITPLDVLSSPTLEESRAYAVADTQLTGLKGEARKIARAELVERAAYTWINRLLALRAMEARGLVDETLRSNPEYDKLSEALFVLRQTSPARTMGADGGWWAVLEDACNTQKEALPGLFDLKDPNAALRPSTPALLTCIRVVGGLRAGFSLEECDAAFADPDAIGWAYQFYQEAAKARVYAKLGSGGKAGTRAEIAAATQLFTEPYMVQWLLQNSLGRSYHELYPESRLPESWPYYIKPETPENSPGAAGLATLTVIDPCAGSGHFLREAFDMLVAMYREQFPGLKAAQIADNILERHLHGIDLDPRAAQLAVLTLYLRAWELVRDERKKERKPGPSSYRPPRIKLASTPSGIGPGALERHLRRHPQDRLLKPVLEGIFASLEQADILGSLLRPREYLDKAITALQGNYTIPMDEDPADAQLRQSIIETAQRDPLGLRKMLLDRIASTFQEEAGQLDDVATALFGREAVEGMLLLQLLEQKYAVVVTNPPYMGSKNMDNPLRKFVEQHYKSGKRDLYAAFILRCLELCRSQGRIAMVTQQSWMFLRSFAELRAIAEENLAEARKKDQFTGLLRETVVEALAHLGPNAFEEISGEVVQSVMFTLLNYEPDPEHRLTAFRLVGLKTPNEKSKNLKKISFIPENQSLIYRSHQLTLQKMPDGALMYWLPEKFSNIFTNLAKLSSKVSVLQGLATADDNRCLRFSWEVLPKEVIKEKKFFPITKGGGKARWAGQNYYVCEWAEGGARMRFRSSTRIQNENAFWLPLYSYSLISGGVCSVRAGDRLGLFGHKGPAIIPPASWQSLDSTTSDKCEWLQPVLQSRVATFLLRAMSPNLAFEVNTMSILPIPDTNHLTFTNRPWLDLKWLLLANDPIERTYNPNLAYSPSASQQNELIACWLATGEAWLDTECIEAYGLDSQDLNFILVDTGIPAGFYPLITGYDMLPELSAKLGLPSLPEGVLEFLAEHERINPDNRELARLKANLRSLYEAGPGAKNVEQEEADSSGEEEEAEETVSGAHIPIPTETFLEELSVKLQIHPISVYWLLEELRAEGVRCKPEELRLLEDRLSVLVLRLLGHRWPKQIEAGEPVPEWADKDGIIPLISGAGESTLAERLRNRLRDEDGELAAQKTEALLQELTGLNLEEWLRRQFFDRHKRQFKYRPVAWHLASKPQTGGGKKKGGSRRAPAFEGLLYYHACSSDVLARLRTQYLEPLLATERHKLGESRLNKNETDAALAADRVQELEAFMHQLQQVEETGFACPELDKQLEKEPLDRWCGDGYLAPSKDEFWHNERAWKVDLNDGVRVNIAPLQLGGLLTSEVLKAVDAKKAIADRVRWRSDERRWVREGKLPRCGWMPEDLPESQRWTELAPQRAAEQTKLEQKRKAVAEKNEVGKARPEIENPG